MRGRAVSNGPLTGCAFASSSGETGTTDLDGKFSFLAPTDGSSDLIVTIGGNGNSCVDSFSGLALQGKLTSYVGSSNFNSTPVAVTPMSRVAVEWDVLDTGRDMYSGVETEVATFFFTGVDTLDTAYKATVTDHIEALSLGEANRQLGLEVMARMAKVNAVINLGAGYIEQIGSAHNFVTAESSRDYMYASMSDHGFQGKGSEVFDFDGSADTLEVLTGAVAIYQQQLPSRRQLQQDLSADLAALADVMLVVFQSVESQKAEGDVTKVMEGITKTAIAAETEVIKDVEALGAGLVTPEAFKEANTADKVAAKVEAAEVPATFTASVAAAVSGQAVDPNAITPEKGSSGDDDTVIIIVVAVVVPVVAAVGGVLGHRYFKGKKGKQKVAVMKPLDPIAKPGDLERGGLLPPIGSPTGESSSQGQSKVSVMPFVASPPNSP